MIFLKNQYKILLAIINNQLIKGIVLMKIKMKMTNLMFNSNKLIIEVLILNIKKIKKILSKVINQLIAKIYRMYKYLKTILINYRKKVKMNFLALINKIKYPILITHSKVMN